MFGQSVAALAHGWALLGVGAAGGATVEERRAVASGTVAAVYECFDVSISDKVAHLQLKRPDELNTMTPAFWTELPTIVGEIDAAASARAIVISSTGKHF